MTPLDLITLSLKQAGVVGIGQPVQAENANDAFTLLNMMLGQWNRRRWLVYHLVDVAKVATGAQSYTIGIGGDFNVARPDRIESAYVRLLNNSGPNQTDVPLTLMQSMEDYSRIALKSMVAFPSYVFLDSDFPLGRVYLWPVPSPRYEIHLLLKAELPAFDTMSQDIELPAEYAEAIMYNLAGRLRPHFQLPADPSITALARSSLNTVRNANTQIPTLQMPNDLARGWNYNVISDRMN
jgi:hypothetical protein